MSYKKRREFCEARRKLKGTGLFVYDHLTPSRANLLQEGLAYRRAGILVNVWSTEGRILGKDKDSNIHQFHHVADFLRFGVLPDEHKRRPRRRKTADPTS